MCEGKTASRKQGKDPDVTQWHGQEQRLRKEQWEAQQGAQGTEQLYAHRLCGGCSPRKGMAILFVSLGSFHVCKVGLGPGLGRMRAWGGAGWAGVLKRSSYLFLS